MNFYHVQKQARMRAFLLTVGYLLVLVMSLWLFYLFALWAVSVGRYLHNVIGDYHDSSGQFEPRAYPGWWSPKLFLISSGIALLAMIVASIYRVAQLSRGGWVVAEMLGGTQIHPSARNLQERRLLNVVEEIAIAARAQVPVVYLLKGEIGVNAFAAGFSRADAAIGVTRGCLNAMSRDELQAIIAHEFCHILSGDTALKTLLAGLLFGIKAPGYYCSSRFLQMVQGRGDYMTPGLIWLVFVLFSIIAVPFLLTTQAVALLAATLKRMMSVQREYHADARAVEFCRNPAALAGALKKIGGHAAGSRILIEAGGHTSHFFFANPYGHCFLGWSWLLAHPELPTRIRRIEPDFNGTFQRVSSGNVSGATEALYRPSTQPNDRFSGAADEYDDGGGDLVENVLASTAAILTSIPTALQDAVRDVASARSVVIALLLSSEPEIRERQILQLQVLDPERPIDESLAICRVIQRQPLEQKLPLAKLAVRTLKAMSPADYPAFRRDVDDLIRADGRISPLEAALSYAILEQLAPVFEHGKHSRSAPSPDAIQAASRTLLSCLVYWGITDIGEQDHAYRTAIAHVVKTDELPPILARRDCEDDAFNAALRLVARAASDSRSRLLEACRICVHANGRISTMETQLLLTIADALDCPQMVVE